MATPEWRSAGKTFSMDRWLMKLPEVARFAGHDDALPEPERHDGGAVGDLEALRGCDLEGGRLETLPSEQVGEARAGIVGRREHRQGHGQAG